MAEKAKKVAPIVEIEEDIDLDDLDLEDVEIEADPIEEEIEEAAKPKKKSGKTTKKAPTGSTLSSVQPLAEDEVGTDYVAKLCDTDPRKLRAFLRKHYRDMSTEKSQRYRWKKGDPQIQEIVDAFKKAESKARKIKTESEDDED